MTVITAAYNPQTRTAAMAADSSMHRNDLVVRSSPKITRAGLALVGFSGVWSYLRAVRRHCLSHPLTEEEPYDIEEWVARLGEEIARRGQQRGDGDKLDGVMQYPAGVVVATPAGLLTLASDGEVSWVHEPYAAAGAGMDVAMGAMAAMWTYDTGSVDKDSTRIARIGAEIATRHAAYCGGPILVETVCAESR